MARIRREGLDASGKTDWSFMAELCLVAKEQPCRRSLKISVIPMLWREGERKIRYISFRYSADEIDALRIDTVGNN